MAKLVSNLYLSIHSLPEEDCYDTDDASLGKVYAMFVPKGLTFFIGIVAGLSILSCSQLEGVKRTAEEGVEKAKEWTSEAVKKLPGGSDSAPSGPASRAPETPPAETRPGSPLLTGTASRKSEPAPTGKGSRSPQPSGPPSNVGPASPPGMSIVPCDADTGGRPAMPPEALLCYEGQPPRLANTCSRGRLDLCLQEVLQGKHHVYELPWAVGQSFSVWASQPYEPEAHQSLQRDNSQGRYVDYIGNVHHGIAFRMPPGTPIHAVRDGTVEKGFNERGAEKTQYGFYGSREFRLGGQRGGPVIVIRHADNSRALYTYLDQDSLLVKSGDKVSAGQHIAALARHLPPQAAYFLLQLDSPDGHAELPIFRTAWGEPEFLRYGVSYLRTAPGQVVHDQAYNVRKCAHLAESPEDKNRLTNGVALESIQVESARKVCAQALKGEPNNPRLLYHMGRVHLAAKERQQAAKYFVKASELGYALATQSLAEADATVSLDRFQKAAWNGDTGAQFVVGKAYVEGKLGTPPYQGVLLGVAWLDKAAENGHADASQYRHQKVGMQRVVQAMAEANQKKDQKLFEEVKKIGELPNKAGQR